MMSKLIQTKIKKVHDIDLDTIKGSNKMEDTTQKRTGRFNKDLAKKIEDQIADYEGPADSQGVEIKSPGKMFWFTIAGDNYNDIPKVWTVKLFDPDGEEIEYLILADDISLRDRIFEKCDNKQNLKALVRCINWFGTEFLWIPSIRTRGNSKISQQSAKRAIELGQNGWIKAQWKNNSVGWVSWCHPGTEKIADWSKINEEDLINQIFLSLIHI